VLNLASVDEVDAVNRLALTTGADPVPKAKYARGYRHVKDKFAVAGLTPLASDSGRAAARARVPGAARSLGRGDARHCRR